MMSGAPTKQPRLDSYFSPPATSSLSAARQKTCTKKLASFICKDMRTISIVDGTGFKEFCQELEPRYRIPSRGTITNRIEDMYNSTSDNIRELLKDQYVALTTDGWTSLATASYVTATAHWISGDWEMHDYVLKTKYLMESHTAEHVQEVLKPFKVTTEALSTEKYPTASAVLPLKQVLLSQLNTPTADKPEPPALSEMKTKIITDLEKRYSEERAHLCC
ncbi:hypothetical protein D5F01_LYC10977 [Scomber scombrus]|uniref:Uncharacterized protein n=1 Tax=Scomber scombrus TaxID=13677 RepID=A0AAV1Q6Q7_SCOSC